MHTGIGDLIAPAEVARTRSNVAVALGVIGGLLVGKVIYEQAFVEGITSAERRNIFLAGAGLGLWYGLDQLFNMQTQLDQWTTAVSKQVGL